MHDPHAPDDGTHRETLIFQIGDLLIAAKEGLAAEVTESVTAELDRRRLSVDAAVLLDVERAQAAAFELDELLRRQTCAVAEGARSRVAVIEGTLRRVADAIARGTLVLPLTGLASALAGAVAAGVL